MALPSNDINDLKRGLIIESVDVAGQPGQVVLNADGTALGAPVGGATASNQTDGSQKTQIVDAGGEVATITGGKLDVNATASLAGESIPISGATTAVGVGIVDASGNQITSFGGGVQYTEGDVDTSITGTAVMWEDAGNTLQPVSATKPLPVSASIDTTGLATTTTDTNTGTIAGDTTSIDAKVPALGQALAAGSVPVVLTAAQVTTLTPPAAITGFATSAKQLADNHQVTVSNIASTPVGLTDTQLRATAVPVSGTVTANAGTNLNTSALAVETGGNLASIKTNTDKIPALGQALAAASVPVVLTAAQLTTLTPPAQGLTDAQLRATAVPISVATIPSHAVTNAGTFAVQSTNQANSGVDIGDVTINNSTGANAVNIQDGGNSITVDGNFYQATQPVSIASMPSTPVTGTFWQATQPVSGTVTANTGLSQPLTDTQLRATAVPVSVASIPSHAVTNAGTFATQATLAAETTKVIGTVNIASGQTLGTVTSITNTVPTSEVAPSAVLNGKTTVTTAGTRVVLAASTTCKSVTIKALSTNTGLVFVGSSAVASTNGFQLAAGETISMDIANLNTVNIDSAVSGEGVTYLGIN